MTRRKKVCVVGHGSQGRTIAEAVKSCEELRLALFMKSTHDYNEYMKDLLEKVDLVIDCSPSRECEQNYRKYYSRFGVPTIAGRGISDLLSLVKRIPIARN